MVGKKHFVGVTKDMLRARMIGGKSPSVAASLAQGAPELKAELDELQSRKRFDRLLTLAASRGFFGKVGMGRRVYLSIEHKDPVALAGRVRTRFDRLTEYRERERTARNPQLYTVTLPVFATRRGTIGDTIGGIKGYSFNKSLLTRRI